MNSPRKSSPAASPRVALERRGTAHVAAQVVPTPPVANLYVLAGVDGAGKSSIAGAAFRARGVDYFDPDEAALRLMTASPRLGQAEADSQAWQQGRRLLERAIAECLDHAFETTLGADTMPRLLAAAAAAGIAVHVWYAGLKTPGLHVDRVRSRVGRGGRDMAADLIRRRYQHSRLNLIELLPCLVSLRLYDNSADADPASGVAPHPTLLLHIDHGRIAGPEDLAATPDWARPIVAAALKLDR